MREKKPGHNVRGVPDPSEHTFCLSANVQPETRGRGGQSEPSRLESGIAIPPVTMEEVSDPKARKQATIVRTPISFELLLSATR